ncbi:MAG: class I SAM-dependent methyltransferase [Patescibacteria group bacterium]
MNKQTQKNLLKIVKENYEEIADQFNETRKKYIWPGLLELAKTIKAEDKILDVGCGNGRLLEAFKNRKINYLGIDSSKPLIEHAQKLYPENNFRVGDILDLGKIPEINFDYVFSVAVLHHLPGQDLQIAALKQIKNKVSENGKIIIIVWNLWNQKKFRKLIIKFFLLKLIKKNLPVGKMDFGDILFDWKNPNGEKISRRYYHAFTKMGLRKIIKKSGLKIEKLYKDEFNYYAILKK